MPEFDFPSAIKELAEAKLPCPGDGYGVIHALAHCSRCDDTAFIKPFASLRIISHSQSCPEYGRAVKYNHEPNKICTGYRTSPDVRVVCWEIFESHPEIIRRMMEQPELYGEYEIKEALIRAALAEVKEQHGT